MVGQSRGTHGSITKAGKVRSQTPKVEKTSKNRSSSFPRKRWHNKQKKLDLERLFGHREDWSVKPEKRIGPRERQFLRARKR